MGIVFDFAAAIFPFGFLDREQTQKLREKQRHSDKRLEEASAQTLI